MHELQIHRKLTESKKHNIQWKNVIYLLYDSLYEI